MACRGGSVTITPSYQHLDMRVQQGAGTPTACVISTPHTAIVYSNALDMNVVLCVTGDSSFFYGVPLGEPVLGDNILG